MNARHEDGPPCIETRSYKDVIDHGNAICAAERARKWMLAIRYHVDFGYQGAHTQHFVEFAPALTFYMDHLSDGVGPFAPVIRGYAFDETSDGLTDEERQVVALVREA